MKNTRAFVLLTTLLVAVVLTMLTTALLKTGVLSMASGGRYRDRVRAREMAIGGLNHALHVLSYNRAFASNIAYTSADDESYSARFASGECINNLSSVIPSLTLDVRGLRTPPHAADLVITGRAGSEVVRIHALVGSGYFFQRAIGADGQVRIDSSCNCTGVVSLSTQIPAGGGIFSNHQTTGANDPAINVTAVGGPAFAASPLVRFEARPAASGAGPSVIGIPTAYQAQVVSSSSPSQSIPSFQVNALVSNKSSAPAFSDFTAFNQAATTTIRDERYHNGPLTVYGDVNLSGGTLFIHGDLIVNGGIMGTGSVFVDGDVQINGGVSSVKTNQNNGASLYASGNVTMQALNAFSLLGSISDPIINADLATLQNKMQDLNNVWSTTTNVSLAELACVNFTSPAWGEHHSGGYRVIPFQGPTGYYSLTSGDNPALTLASSIRSRLTGYSTNTQAKQLVRSLEQLAYATRTNLYVADPGWVPNLDINYHSPNIVDVTYAAAAPTVHFPGHHDPHADAITCWDDAALVNDPSGSVRHNKNAWASSLAAINLAAFGSLTPDHQVRALWGSNLNVALPTPLSVVQQSMLDNYFNGLRSFVSTHDFNLNWMSYSNFQGLVFAQGNVTVNGNFQIIGALLSNSNVTMTGKSILVYDQEYFQQLGSFAPLQTLFVEDLP